jgi:hypothetical protein
MVFNATFNNKKIPEDLSIRGLRLWSDIKHHNLNPLILKSSGIFLLLKVALNTITLTLLYLNLHGFSYC